MYESKYQQKSAKNVFCVVLLMTLFCGFDFFLFLCTVPPRIAEEVSSSSVICEMQTLCTLSCHATSSFPFNYSWTKNGQVPVGDDIKIMNNIIVLTPRDAEDYGVYVCQATNSFGSTSYKITLSEDHKSSGTIQDVSETHMERVKGIVRLFSSLGPGAAKFSYVKYITSILITVVTQMTNTFTYK